MKEDANVCCPYLQCHGRPSHLSLKDLKVHFYDCHGLPEKGFAVTRGVVVGSCGALKVWSKSDTDQDQKEEFDLKWSQSQDSGVASLADDTWENIMKQTSPEFKNDSILDSEDPLFRVNAIMDLDEAYSLSYLGMTANSWNFPEDSWFWDKCDSRLG